LIRLIPADRAFLAPLCEPVSPESLIAALVATGFSVEAYRDAHQDLVKHCSAPEQALAHFFRWGVFERRLYPVTLDIDALCTFVELPVHARGFVATIAASLCHAHGSAIAEPDAARVAQWWMQLGPLRARGARPYLVIGDSHSWVLRRSVSRGGQWLVPLHLLCSAGSAVGLGNPSSRSGYGARLRSIAALLEELQGAKSLPVLLQFGQVDTEFVHPFRRLDRGVTRFDREECQDFCRRSVDSYIGFVQDAFAKSLDQLDVVSIFPPALSDVQWAAGYVNAHIASLESALDVGTLRLAIRALEIPDIRGRTDIHREYNQLLQKACQRAGLRFVDAFTPLLGGDGLLDPSFVPVGRGADHHLEFWPTEAVAATLLWNCIDRSG